MDKSVLDKYEAVIGLEVHAQVRTKTKMFCRCSTRFGDAPNSNTCPTCMGMPGALPVANENAVEKAIMASLGFNFQINEISQFSRKNYFYPDLTKGYQITQYDKPIAERGYLNIDLEGELKKVAITRLHIEEDAGKSQHDDGPSSKVDYNRCGVPLVEIVSEPDIASPAEAELYLQKLRQILVYLEVCDGNMEEGSLRCDGNLSIRPRGSKELFTKTEVKNLNSFRFVRKALEYEFLRQVEVVESGGKVQQETRLWDQAAGVTRMMRSKEEAHDYRYFPEPDLQLLRVDQKWVNRVKEQMPELPDEKIARLEKEYAIPHYDATILATERPLADYYEAVAAKAKDKKAASNWVMGEVLRVIKEKHLDISEFPVKADDLASLVNLVKGGSISGASGKEVFAEMVEHPEKNPNQIVKEKNLAQVSDESELRAQVIQIIKDNPKPYGQYREGKTATFGFFVGQMMKATRGRANPKIVQTILKEILDAEELPEA